MNWLNSTCKLEVNKYEKFFDQLELRNQVYYYIITSLQKIPQDFQNFQRL